MSHMNRRQYGSSDNVIYVSKKNTIVKNGKVSEAKKNSGHRGPPPYHPIILEAGSFSNFYYNASHESDSDVALYSEESSIQSINIARDPG